MTFYYGQSYMAQHYKNKSDFLCGILHILQAWMQLVDLYYQVFKKKKKKD